MKPYVFTQDDQMNPVYCLGCRQHIPKAVSNAGKGLCPVCRAIIGAQPPAAPPMPVAAPNATPGKSRLRELAAISGAICLLIYAFWFTLSDSRSPHPQNSMTAPPAPAKVTPPQSPVQPTIPTEEMPIMTPDALVNFYSQNPVNAKDWLDGRIIGIKGVISGVSNNTFGGEDAAIVFSVNNGSFLNPDIVVWYASYFRPELGKMKQGQQVTCIGKFESSDFSGGLTFHGTDLID